MCQEIPQDNAVYTEVQEKKLLLKQMQPPSFKGEGMDIEKEAESWIETMDDYFTAVGTTATNRSMLALFRLSGEAKLWWKQHCRDIGISENSQSWSEIKQAVKERYLPPAHEALKMNEFFRLRQLSLTLEEYYSKFVTLQRHAPPRMSIEQQVTRFCQGLNEPVSLQLEAMSPSTVQDALLRAKPLIREQISIRSRGRFQQNRGPNDARQQEGSFHPRP